jgi:hypothetical protein
MWKWQALVSRIPHCDLPSLEKASFSHLLRDSTQRKEFTECIRSKSIGWTLITPLKNAMRDVRRNRVGKFNCFCWNIKTSAVCVDFWFWYFGKLSLVEHLIVTYLR